MRGLQLAWFMASLCAAADKIPVHFEDAEIRAGLDKMLKKRGSTPITTEEWDLLLTIV